MVIVLYISIFFLKGLSIMLVVEFFVGFFFGGGVWGGVVGIDEAGNVFSSFHFVS